MSDNVHNLDEWRNHSRKNENHRLSGLTHPSMKDDPTFEVMFVIPTEAQPPTSVLMFQKGKTNVSAETYARMRFETVYGRQVPPGTIISVKELPR